MTRILTICGSTRDGSTNRGLLRAVANMIQGRAVVTQVDIAALPHFSPDIPSPPAVNAYQEALRQADLLLIATPEYAHGLPGVLKNALDWVVADEYFPGKRVAVIFGSTGDAANARIHLLEILTTMCAQIDESLILHLPGSRSKVDREGRFLQPAAQAEVAAFVERLLS